MKTPTAIRPTSPPGTGRHSPGFFSLLPLAGFVVALLALFAVAYEVGSGAGPVVPGVHPTDSGHSTQRPKHEPDHGHDMGGMSGMGGM